VAEILHLLICMPILAMGFALWQNGCVCLVCSCVVIRQGRQDPGVGSTDWINQTQEYETTAGSWTPNVGSISTTDDGAELRMVRPFPRMSGTARATFRPTAHGQKVRLHAGGATLEAEFIDSSANGNCAAGVGTRYALTYSGGTTEIHGDGFTFPMTGLQVFELSMCFNGEKLGVQAEVFELKPTVPPHGSVVPGLPCLALSWVDHDADDAEVRVGIDGDGSAVLLTEVLMVNHKRGRSECPPCNDCGFGCEDDSQPTGAITLEFTGFTGAGSGGFVCTQTECNFFNDNLFILSRGNGCSWQTTYTAPACLGGGTLLLGYDLISSVLKERVTGEGSIEETGLDNPRDCSAEVVLDEPVEFSPGQARWGGPFAYCGITSATATRSS